MVSEFRIVERSSYDNPVEWVVESDDGRIFDLHYRWGELRVWQQPHDYDDRKTTWRAQLGGEWSGEMDDETMLAHLRRWGG